MAMKQQDENDEKINVRDRLTDNVLDLSLMNISKVPVQEIVSIEAKRGVLNSKFPYQLILLSSRLFHMMFGQFV